MHNVATDYAWTIETDAECYSSDGTEYCYAHALYLDEHDKPISITRSQAFKIPHAIEQLVELMQEDAFNFSEIQVKVQASQTVCVSARYWNGAIGAQSKSATFKYAMYIPRDGRMECDGY